MYLTKKQHLSRHGKNLKNEEDQAIIKKINFELENYKTKQRQY